MSTTCLHLPELIYPSLSTSRYNSYLVEYGSRYMCRYRAICINLHLYRLRDILCSCVDTVSWLELINKHFQSNFQEMTSLKDYTYHGASSSLSTYLTYNFKIDYLNRCEITESGVIPAANKSLIWISHSFQHNLFCWSDFRTRKCAEATFSSLLLVDIYRLMIFISEVSLSSKSY